MFCGKCGAKNEPGATFCGVCGAPLGAGAPADGTGAPAGGQPAPEMSAGGTVTASVHDSRKYKKIGIAAVAVIVVVAIFAVTSLFGGRSDTKTAEQLFEAVLDADADAIVDLIPTKIIDQVVEESGYTREEVADELYSLTDNLKYAMGYLDDSVKISYHATDSEDVDASQLSSLKEQYKEMDVNVSAARDVNVELQVKADSLGLDQSTSVEIPVIKVGNSWYIDVTRMS